MSKNVAVAAIAALLTFTSGGLHHVLTGTSIRSGVSITQADLEQLPENLGPWQKTADGELPEAALDILQCDRHLTRRYRHTQTGGEVEILVMVGPSASMAAHTPEVCYSTQTFDLLDNDQVLSIPVGEEQHELRLVELRGRDVNRTTLNVAYGWNNGSGWRAPEMARLVYAGTSDLLKVQVALPVADPSIDADQLMRELLEQLIPALSALD